MSLLSMEDNLNKEQKATLMKWQSRYKRAQLAHSYTAITFGRYHLILGTLLILLATASAVLIFARDITPLWLSPSVGIAAAFLAYLQTFLRLSEQADLQRSVARRYGALKKKIEYLIDFENDSSRLNEKVDQIREKEEDIASDAPHALMYHWRRAKKETQKTNGG